MESGPGAEKDIEQLSEEELYCVLKQLTDHSLPDSEKCPLVQRLKKENKEEKNKTIEQNGTSADLGRLNCTKTRHENRWHGSSGGGGSVSIDCTNVALSQARKQQELCPNHNNNCDDDSCKLNTSISTSSEMNHIRDGSGVANRKPNRANSFTMPSKSDNSGRCDTTFPITEEKLTNGGGVGNCSEVSREPISGGNKQMLSGGVPLPNHKSSSSALSRPASHQSCSNSSHYSLSDTIATDHNNTLSSSLSSSSKSAASNSYSSVHLQKIGTFVETFDHFQSNTRPNKQSYTVQEEDEEKPEFPEMKNLHSKANIYEYSRDLPLNYLEHNLDNNQTMKPLNHKQIQNVDKTLEMPMLSTNGDNSHHASNSIISTVPNLFNPQAFIQKANNSISSNTTNIRKKKKRKETVILSDQIKDYVGNTNDIDRLVQFVESPSSNLPISLSNLSNDNSNVKQQKGKANKNENENGKRAKSNNGDLKTSSDSDKRNPMNKAPLSSASNSSSLSGDDMIVGKSSKTKKGKSKNKDKNGKLANGKSTSFNGKGSKVDKMDSSKESKEDVSTNAETNKTNSSSDATESDDEIDEPIIFYRSKKSNSIWSTPPTSTNVVPIDDENLCTVSDSEMADQEKGFVTPKNKHFKKKKMQQNKILANDQANGKQVSNKNLPFNSSAGGVHNLGRGYESELESYSANNNLQPFSFTSQSLSSSMLTISRIPDKRPPRNSSPTNLESTPMLPNSTEDPALYEVEFSPTNDTQDSGPKMPSYADIAKSVHQPTNVPLKIAHVATSTSKPSQPADNLSTVDEFPQLNSQSFDEIESNDLSDTDSKHFTEETAPAKQSPLPVQTDSVVFQMESENDNNCDQPQSSDEPMNLNGQLEPLSFSPLVKGNEEFHVKSPPLIFYGCSDNGNVQSSDEGCVMNGEQLQLAENVIHKQSKDIGVIFGFFEENEMSMLKEDNNFGALFITNDHSSHDVDNSESTANLKVDDNKSEQVFETVNSSTGVDHSTIDFKNKAVHVQDLEDTQFRKLNNQDNKVQTNQGNKVAYSSSTASPLSSSFDSSPGSSAANSSSSSNVSNSTTTGWELKQEETPFVSCISQLSNFKFIDNVDRNSFNYTNVFQYVHQSWNQFNGIEI